MTRLYIVSIIILLAFSSIGNAADIGFINGDLQIDSVNIATGESYMFNASPILWINETTYNTIFGKGAGAILDADSTNNTLLGEDTGAVLDDGDYNVYIGWQAGYAAAETTSQYSVIVGARAAQNTTNPDKEVYIGYMAGWDTGAAPNDNTYVGFQAGSSAEGDKNIALGSLARNASDASGDGNIHIGYLSGALLSTGTNNVIIGTDAGDVATTADQSVYIGNEAGDTITTGDGNIVIGYQADLETATHNYTIVIGYQALATSSNQAVIGSATDAAELNDIYLGQGVRDTSPQGIKIHATGGSGSDNAGGDIYVIGGKGTGNATPGDIIFQTADKQASGSTLQSVKTSGRFTDTEFIVELEQVYDPSNAQVINAVGDTILANATVVELNPNGDYTLTSTPTIADGTKGQILFVTCGNSETNTVTVQDEDTLGSSNLELGAATRAISGKDVLQLLFDGTDWLEVSFQDN